VTNDRIIMKDEIERMWKEVVVTCFKVSAQYLLGP